ncbi:hypothetical protein EWM64_g3634 [Hericium alpestre]|uniref:Uncharacterized protein n=1 Tax=Hericium alpestre TaxID=135208 RepID=A0A4Z0A3W0_9AGAM|nr:hypothetical protein EWM64_g3634 [Hericium alpestre]
MPVNKNNELVQPPTPKALTHKSSNSSALGSRKPALEGDDSDSSELPFEKRLFEQEIKIASSNKKKVQGHGDKKKIKKIIISMDHSLDDDPFHLADKSKQKRKKQKVVFSNDESQPETMDVEKIEVKGKKEDKDEEEEEEKEIEEKMRYVLEMSMKKEKKTFEDENDFILKDCNVTELHLIDKLLKKFYHSLPSLHNPISLTGGSNHVLTLGASLLTENEYENITLDYLIQIMTFTNNMSLNLINPAYTDPALFEANNALHRGIISKETGEVCLFMMIEFVVKSNLVDWRKVNSGKDNARFIRELYVSPLSMEWERTLAFYSAVFNKRKFSIFCLEGGVPFTMLMGDEVPILSSQRQTPKVKATKSSTSSASSSLSKGGNGVREMTKHPLGLLDTIPIWDCTHYYKRLGSGGALSKGDPWFLFIKAHKHTKPVKGDLELGDLIVVIHTTTEYMKRAYTHLNLNVQGISFLLESRSSLHMLRL